MKHLFWHKDAPPFLLRDPNNPMPQPSTNFSQTFQLKIPYKEAVRTIEIDHTPIL